MLQIQFNQFYVFFFILAVAVPLCFARRIGPVYAVTWGLFLIQGTMFALPKLLPSAPGVVKMSMAPATMFLQTQSLQTLILLYLLPLLFLVRLRIRQGLTSLAFHFCGLNAVYVIYQLINGENQGFIEASSFDLAIGFVFLPLLFQFEKLNLFQKINLFVILLAGFFVSSMSLYTMVAAFIFGAALLKIRNADLTKNIKACAVAGLVILGAGVASILYSIYIPGRIGAPGTRLDIWGRALERFSIEPWGHGAGAFKWFGISTPTVEGPRYLIAHNEYLQILIEQGSIPFAALCLTLLFALRFFYKTKGLEFSFLALLSILTLSVSYYPLRYPISLVLVCLIMADAFNYKKILGNIDALERLRKI